MLAPPAAVQVYELSEGGEELEPVFEALAWWGSASPAMPTDGDLSPDAVLLGLRTFFEAGDADWTTTYEIRVAPDVYRVRRGVSR